METSVKPVQAKVPVTILKLKGELDAKWYQDVIAKAKTLYDSGVRDLLIDMSGLVFMASSGLVALHSTALIMRGDQIPETNVSWSTFRTDHVHIGPESDYEIQCKLLNLQSRILRTLELAGFDEVSEIFDDEKVALNSFG